MTIQIHGYSQQILASGKNLLDSIPEIVALIRNNSRLKYGFVAFNFLPLVQIEGDTLLNGGVLRNLEVLAY